MLTFAELVQQPDFKLDHAALLLAKEIAYHNLDVAAVMAQLDDFSRIIEQRLSPHDSPADKLRRISEFLFDEEGFHGNTSDYYDPRNSFLNDVLLRHSGIPITLSILYIAIGERLGLPVYGVGLPGHFIVGCSSENGSIYLDPFHQGLMLDEEECRQIALDNLPSGMPFSRTFLARQTNRMILMRMLNNLRQIYLNKSNADKLLSVLRLQCALAPEDPELQRDLGILYIHQERWGKVAQHLRYYLYRRPHAGDLETIQALLNEAMERLSKLN